jgi:hypothetical protein
MSRSLVDPHKVNYLSQVYEMTVTSVRTGTMIFKTTIIEDDQGWFIEDPKKSEKLSYFANPFNTAYLTREMIVNESWSLYILNFQVNKLTSIYTRTFDKIPDLLARVGGVISAIQKLLFLLYVSAFSYIPKEKLMNAVFAFPGKTKNLNNFLTRKESEIKLQNISTQLKLFKNEKKQKEINLKSKKAENSEFGFIFNLKLKFGKAKNDESGQVYNNMNAFLLRNLDLTCYLNTLQQFQVLKLLILNSKQAFCLDYLPKPNAFDKDELEKYNIYFERDCKTDQEIIKKYLLQKTGSEPNTIDTKLKELILK